MLPRQSIFFFFYGSFIYLLNCFHKYQDQYLVSIIESMQDDKYFLIREDVIHQKLHQFIFVYHDRILLVNRMQIR